MKNTHSLELCAIAFYMIIWLLFVSFYSIFFFGHVNLIPKNKEQECVEHREVAGELGLGLITILWSIMPFGYLTRKRDEKNIAERQKIVQEL